MKAVSVSVVVNVPSKSKAAIERGQSDACIDSVERELARRQLKAAIERGQSDACIDSAERELARQLFKAATIFSFIEFYEFKFR
jgi:hypothetical protein